MSRKTKRKKPEPTFRVEQRPDPRLYLVTPALGEAREFAPKLEAALASADVACVLVALAGADAEASRAMLDDLGEIAARHGAALLVLGDARTARLNGADGAHIRGAGPALDAAIAALKPDFIVGASGVKSRHDCMTVGEADIDYIMFGDPAPDGWTPPMEDTLERVGWWAEIFNIPCVGFAPSLDEVGPLVAAGADFVALGDAVWNDPRGPAAAAKAAEGLMRGAVEAP